MTDRCGIIDKEKENGEEEKAEEFGKIIKRLKQESARSACSIMWTKKWSGMGKCVLGPWWKGGYIGTVKDQVVVKVLFYGQ